MAFQILAIVILTAFYGCYVAKFISQKRKGIQTDQMGKGKVGAARAIEVTMKLSAVLVFLAGLISIATGTTRGPAWLRVAGLAVSAVGTVIFIISVVTMRDSWRAGVPQHDKTELVTDGIYRFSRNPAFLGFDLLYVGILLMFFNWVLCALSAFAIVMYHLQIISVEEKYLLAAHGEAYRRYKSRVRRYLGRRRDAA